MGTARRIFGFLVGAALVSAAAAAAVYAGPGGVGERLRRAALHGGPVAEVRVPHPRQVVPVGSIEVLVGFPGGDRVAVGTFRCLLNDRDVTKWLTVGRNGAGGSLTGLLEGPNTLTIQVFGQSWWGGAFYEDSQTVEFRVRPLPNFDRALRAPTRG